MLVRVGTRGFWKGSIGAVVISDELRRIRQIERRVLGELHQMLRRGGERAAKNRLMNQIDAETNRMLAGRVGHIVKELVLLLIAGDRERRNGSDELVVAKRLKSGRGQKG